MPLGLCPMPALVTVAHVMLGALPTRCPAQSTAWVLAACVSLAGQAAHGFTPTRQEACCQAVVQGLADAAPCGGERPSVEVCTEVLAAMSRAAEAQARARAQTQTQTQTQTPGPDERSPTEVRPRPPSSAGRSIAVGLVGVLAAWVTRRVLGRRPMAVHRPGERTES